MSIVQHKESASEYSLNSLQTVLQMRFTLFYWILQFLFYFNLNECLDDIANFNVVL